MKSMGEIFLQSFLVLFLAASLFGNDVWAQSIPSDPIEGVWIASCSKSNSSETIGVELKIHAPSTGTDWEAWDRQIQVVRYFSQPLESFAVVSGEFSRFDRPEGGEADVQRGGFPTQFLAGSSQGTSLGYIPAITKFEVDYLPTEDLIRFHSPTDGSSAPPYSIHKLPCAEIFFHRHEGLENWSIPEYKDTWIERSTLFNSDTLYYFNEGLYPIDLSTIDHGFLLSGHDYDGHFKAAEENIIDAINECNGCEDFNVLQDRQRFVSLFIDLKDLRFQGGTNLSLVERSPGDVNRGLNQVSELVTIAERLAVGHVDFSRETAVRESAEKVLSYYCYQIGREAYLKDSSDPLCDHKNRSKISAGLAVFEIEARSKCAIYLDDSKRPNPGQSWIGAQETQEYRQCMMKNSFSYRLEITNELIGMAKGITFSLAAQVADLDKAMVCHKFNHCTKLFPWHKPREIAAEQYVKGQRNYEFAKARLTEHIKKYSFK